MFLGIDLGTTNSIACIWDGNNYKIIKNNNSNLFPSIIEFTKNGKIICSNNIKNSIKNIKRFIGKNPSDISILKLLSDLHFDCQIMDNQILFNNKFENKNYTLEELNGLILRKIKLNAEEQLNIPIKKVVVTVPAHFDQIQRNSVITSCKLAKLDCIRLINEPTAAALAYGLQFHDDVNILVFDIGGGTTDISILNIDDGIFEVLSTYGDNFLGGENFTKIIQYSALEQFRENNKLYKLNEQIIKDNLYKLYDYSNKFKCKKIDKININNFYEDKNNNILLDLNYNIKRNEISFLFNNLLKKLENYINITLASAELNKDDIDFIILVGGCSKLDEIKMLLKQYFNKDLVYNIDQELVVAIGAGIQGFILANPESPFSENLALVDIVPLSIGIESDNGIMTKIINKGAKIPITKSKLFTNKEDNQNEINIQIFQGERELVKDNMLIGEFILKNIKMKNRGKNIIKVEISVDNNCMIKIIAREKGTNNRNELLIKNKLELFDDKLIEKLIEESEKYANIDEFKMKLKKIENILNHKISNMKYNCFYNEFIKLDEIDKDKLKIFINEIKVKKNKILDILNKSNCESIDYENSVFNLKKILKIIEKKYPMFAKFYDNENNKSLIKTEKDNFINFNNDNEYNNNVMKEINNFIKNTSNSSISKYSKNNIINYLNNITYKLKSINLDSSNYDDYLYKINKNINNFIINDKEMIQNYGNIKTVKELITKNKIVFEIENLNHLSNIDIFNLLYDICNKFNIQIEN